MVLDLGLQNTCGNFIQIMCARAFVGLSYNTTAYTTVWLVLGNPNKIHPCCISANAMFNVSFNRLGACFVY